MKGVGFRGFIRVWALESFGGVGSREFIRL